MLRHPLLAVACLALACSLACATGPSGGRGTRSFDWFSQTGLGTEDDTWYPKVEEWQGRARAEGTRLPKTDRGPRSAEFSGQLLHTMGSFRDEERRAFAERVHHWAQRIARKHYKFDPGDNDPVYDRWPTVGELLANNGDDCDGLDLIAYQLLREFGFPREQLFRAIVRRNRDNANHMVTLWFEDPSDPWVLDATGAVAIEFHRMSNLPGWTPTKLFNENQQWNVAEKATGPAVAAGE